MYDPTLYNPLDADDEFIKNLRQSLQESYDTGLANLEETRRQARTSTMSNANTAGMMYSNFPQREQIRYDTNTYMPALTNLRNTYQTGLDSLRNAGVSAANQVAYYQQMIDYYNSLAQDDDTTTTTTNPDTTTNDDTTSESTPLSVANNVVSAALSVAKNLAGTL